MIRRRRDSARGQGTVEFALVLPIFMLLVFAIIDGGRVVYANNELAQATRVVARVASTACFQTTPSCDVSSGPIAAAIASQRSSALVAATWTVSCFDTATNAASAICKTGDRVVVAASSPFGFVTPVASSIGSVTVGSRTEQEILQ
jgi:Flp pilus assembly protein TadG